LKIKKYKKRNGTNTGGSESSNNSPRDETASNNIIRDIAEKTTPLTKFLLKILPTAQREILKILTR